MYRGLMTDFEDDPFFRDHHQRMQSMMGGFHDPFSPFGYHPALPGGNNRGQAGRSHHGSRQLAQPTDVFGGMFGQMFTNMNSMMANMHRNFEQMANDPNTYSYSSSSVMSYSSDGRGEPKYFQATKSTKKAPGGVRETQHSVRDSESGLHRMAIGHHLDDRSHVIERSVNKRSGEEERKQDFINLDESDAAAFDQEWKQRTRDSSNILRDRQRTSLRALEDYRERPNHHSRHAGVAAPSKKDNTTVRDRDKLRVNSEVPGTHREFENRHRDHGVAARDRLRINGEGPGIHREFENRHRDHGAVRDRDWGSGDFDRAGRSHRTGQDRDKHVRVSSRPVNRHEPRGGL